MLLVVHVMFEQFINRLLRLPTAAALGNVARVASHGHEVEVSGKAVKRRECNVQKKVSVQSICLQIVSVASQSF